MITLRDVLKAKKVLNDLIVHTPLVFSEVLSAEKKAEIYLKLESCQKLKMFKIRGALYKMSRLSLEERKKGVVTATTGSHGIGLSYAGKIYGVKATICVPETAVEEKIALMKRLEGEVLRVGKDYDEAYSKALEIQKETDAIFVPSVGDPEVIAAQGTVGFELFEDEPSLETIICPVGGGGLISGISVVAKAVDPKIKVIGVQAVGASAIYESWKTGKIVEKTSVNTIADGIATRKPQNVTFNIIQKYVDDFLCVDDEEIKKAIEFLLKYEHLIAEPAGAASTAALLFKYYPEKGEKIASIISGANISTNLLMNILSNPKY